MHHKRKGPKSGRCGCLLCKPYKRQGAPLKDRQRHSANRRLRDTAGQLAALASGEDNPSSSGDLT